MPPILSDARRRDLRAFAATTLATILTFGLLQAVDLKLQDRVSLPGLINGPFAWLLASSTDLGPSNAERVRLTVALRSANQPVELTDWAQHAGLEVHWRVGDSWASLEGRPGPMAKALDVRLHDFRGRLGQVFYASPQQPAVPSALRREVAGLGRLLSYSPHRESKPVIAPRDVPDQGLNPESVLRTYDAETLRQDGFTGKGVTVIVFAFDGFDQADLDMFSTTFGLPKFTPDVIGGMPTARRGEATMDLEAVHGIAPDAKKVLINARPTVEGDNTYQRIANMMEAANRRYPGAVWSFSIGWGCDKLITAADLAPVRAAVAAAQRNGTTAFNASGDMAGLECKGGQAWSTPPNADEIGLDAVASMPEMTNVGGTTLSTDPSGRWLAEQAWFDPPLSLGTGGGESAIFDRPVWQGRTNVPRRGPGKRQIPDIAAVADPFTGIKIVFNRQVAVGGGTSLAAPVWAGLTAMMNQYLIEHGGRPLGDLNPLLYAVAAGSPLPAFRDVTLGGNAVASAHPGYDMVTGLGTPRVDNLVQNLLVAPRLFD